MKSLKQYIMEKMSKEEFLDKIHNIYNDDYEKVLNILTNNDEEIITNFCKKKHISPKIFIELKTYKNLSYLIEKLNDDKNLLTIQDLSEKENIFNLVAKKLDIINDEDFKRLLINISKYKVDVGKTSKGRFEYFLYFFLKGTRDNLATTGDVIFKDTQIEVKYCNGSNFKAYNSGTLDNETVFNILNNSDNNELLKKILITSLTNKFNKSENEILIENFIKHKSNFNLKNENEIKEFIGICQLYLYLNNEYKELNKQNQYLILFAKETKAKYGNYILLNVKDYKNNIEKLIEFCKSNISWGRIYRNTVEFFLKN